MKIVFRVLMISMTIVFNSMFCPAQTGKISGTIKDDKTGEPLVSVNVIVAGTNYGSVSDIDGHYSIIGIPPGVYSLKASLLGYSGTLTKDIRVSIDLTSKVDIKMSETSLQLKDEVVITATRPNVTKDLTSSTAIINAEQISMLPVTEFQEVLQLKAGMVGGSVKGGRRGEVVYAIDGVPVTDVYDGSTVVDVNANSIQELQFVSGAFNAEYGKALSGYVNIATKEGDNTLSGSITLYAGDYVSSHANIFRAIDNINLLSIRNAEASLSGSIIPNTVSFYLNGRYIYFGGWLNGKRVYNPWDITINKGASLPVEERYVINASGDGAIVPMNWNMKQYGQSKLTFKPMSGIKINYNFIFDNVDYRDYNQSFSFNPDGDFKKFRNGNTNILTLIHTLSPTTFYQANASYFFKRFKQYVYEDPFDQRYTHYLLSSQQPAEIPSFMTGGTQSSRFARNTSTIGGKIDVASQISQEHLVKAGAEFNQHNLFFENINMIQEIGLGDPSQSGNPYARYHIPSITNPDENLNIDIYERRPVEISGYIQDKIELSEMIINIGVRIDYFSPDGKLLTDPADPDIYRPRKPQNIYAWDSNNDGQLGQGDALKTAAERKSYWYKKAEPDIQLSPRLGVAFPITDKGVIHFSYGHFFQIPSFELLYQNPEYKFGQGTQNLGIAGNPGLKPQQTISGEVGVQQALADDITIDLTGYFRDIRNLAGTRADEIRLFGGSASYSQYVNSDFGFVKGIVFTLTKNLSNNWSATLDYTLQSAKGNASDPAASRNQIAGGEIPEIKLLRLNWDQTHTVNITFTYASSDQWGFSCIGQYGSGFPYTPSQSLNVSSLLINSELKPSYLNVDLRMYKNFAISDYMIGVFARVNNLFDILNQVNVYNDSGTADWTMNEYLRKKDDYPDRLVNSLDEYYRNPAYYSEPRRIEIGVQMSF